MLLICGSFASGSPPSDVSRLRCHYVDQAFEISSRSIRAGPRATGSEDYLFQYIQETYQTLDLF